jgi:hypothetical protein
MIENIDQLHSLKQSFEEKSVLKFTYEVEINKKLPFLDVILQRENNKLDTSVYRKKTNMGDCMNFKSLCPDRYKEAVIKTYLHRAYLVCNSWHSLCNEHNTIKQFLVNNGFPVALIDRCISNFMTTKFEGSDANNLETVDLFYRNQFTREYKNDEKELKKVIERNIKTVNPRAVVKLCIYYRNRKLRNLLIHNKMHKSPVENHIVYTYTCPESRCNSATYIGYTTCTINKRFYMHVQSGAINLHNKEVHDHKPVTKLLLENTKIIFRSNDKLDLEIAEALYIKMQKPVLNQQDEGKNRKLFIF